MATHKRKPADGNTQALAAQAEQSLDFRKPNRAIGLRVSEGRLSLIARKLFNVMVHHAQQAGGPGKNSPTKEEADLQYYWMPFADVVRDAAYDSHDTAVLKQHLDSLQDIKIHTESNIQWTSERLVAGVKLVNLSGLRTRGSPIWFGFFFPPEVSKLVLKPDQYTRLSLFYQTMLRSGASLALYELCRRHATNPSKVTQVEDWEWWYGALTGNPVGDALPEFKYFKRDVVKLAIAEINTNTDIRVGLIEHKVGRRVRALQFSVELVKQQPLKFPAPPLINGELITRLQALGFSAEDAGDMTVAHPEERINAAFAALTLRQKAKNSKPLDSVPAYFRWLIKQNLGLAPSAPPVASPQIAREPSGPTLRERYASARATAAIAHLKEVSGEQRRAWMEQFVLTPEGRALKSNRAWIAAGPDWILDERLSTPLLKAAVGKWLAPVLWGEPTATELLAFDETGMVNNAAAAP